MGLYTDADSLFHAKTDRQYQLLLNNRKLDSESAAMRKNIHKLYADVETKIAEVETHLQRMWDVQRRKEKKVPALDSCRSVAATHGLTFLSCCVPRVCAYR
jgi:hypothetical protein